MTEEEEEEALEPIPVIPSVADISTTRKNVKKFQILQVPSLDEVQTYIWKQSNKVIIITEENPRLVWMQSQRHHRT